MTREDVRLPIPHETMRAFLRGAVKAGVLDGWYHYGDENTRRWVINPVNAPTDTLDNLRMEEYVERLWLDGVKAVWRS